MKKLKIIFLLISIIVLLLLSQETSLTITKVTTNFAIRVVPTLAPALLLNNILIYSGGIYPLFENMKIKNEIKHKLYLFSIIILGLVSGTPTLANMVNNEVDKTISKCEAQNILNYFSFPSIPFLFSLLISTNWDYNSALIVILFPFIIGIICFLISMKGKYTPTNCVTINEEQNYISKAILSTFKSLVLMLGSIMLFSLILIPLSLFVNEPYLYYIQGALEFSYPLNYLFQINHNLEKLISMLIITFSSFSLILQIYLIAPKVSIIQVIKKRLFMTLISLFIGVILLI